MMAPDESGEAQRFCVRLLARVLFVVYLVILAWLILFKFSIHIDAVLHYGKRSLNFVPFSKASGVERVCRQRSRVHPVWVAIQRQLQVDGLLSKLLIVLSASIVAETIQYIFAIGATDITDVTTNTLGGLIGIFGYDLIGKYTDQESLDKFIVVAGSVVLGLGILLLIALEVHGVRYHRHGQPS